MLARAFCRSKGDVACVRAPAPPSPRWKEANVNIVGWAGRVDFEYFVMVNSQGEERSKALK